MAIELLLIQKIKSNAFCESMKKKMATQSILGSPEGSKVISISENTFVNEDPHFAIFDHHRHTEA